MVTQEAARQTCRVHGGREKSGVHAAQIETQHHAAGNIKSNTPKPNTVYVATRVLSFAKAISKMSSDETARLADAWRQRAIFNPWRALLFESSGVAQHEAARLGRSLAVATASC
jgi:hypothetical protein